MTTWIVKKAWDQIKTQQEVISGSFLQAGITTRPDGWETAGDISIKPEELVDRLCDEEELSFGPDEYFDDDTLIYVLKRMKVTQLKELAGRKKISAQGNKSDIVEWLRMHLTTEELAGGSITVQIDDPDVVFDVEVIHSYS
ncbi:hypothetical protein FOXG_19654 [Fusarium oxysporum f. sp. lycopersici 4287]|uniref:SAP domain-containing protein n=1 Tax=Fusarium oxysporum f. sp. lycopersici (strain 4287 / CBS 123668 / FGSC 9935 / NRRL 34936) TaxID=426428 RepID=A0A0J9V560_FUSO4|nr:hypothetical protein FOXG_19654 [Fusarium oxysporum f. sp. lycopersici 4287]KNB06380.1 hypothetical protein FOXG_19654 [Fusarium oxysporum f. sp. lycopersici 4287]